MTREEAINHLKTVAKSAIDSGYDSAVVDAVDMAREALEQEPKYCDRNICIQNEYNGIGCDECEVTKSQEPCEDCISRQAALDTFGLSEKSRKYGGDHSGYDTIMFYEVQDVLEALPSIQPKPKTGHWIKGNVIFFRCSECGAKAIISNWSSVLSNYCPNCGAKMVESEDKE